VAAGAGLHVRERVFNVASEGSGIHHWGDGFPMNQVIETDSEEGTEIN
jgi:hypothetical protein